MAGNMMDHTYSNIPNHTPRTPHSSINYNQNHHNNNTHNYNHNHNHNHQSSHSAYTPSYTHTPSHTSNTSISIKSLCTDDPMDIDGDGNNKDNEEIIIEDVDDNTRLAAEALKDLSASSNTTNTTEEPSPSLSGDNIPNETFFGRVSTYPIVNTALKVYDASKSYTVIRYGADMVEKVARPVVKRFEPLDGIAQSALNILERQPSSNSTATISTTTTNANSNNNNNNNTEYAMEVVRTEQRPRWQKALVATGGIGAAISEESLKSLRYCLHWLKYANDAISGSVIALNNLVDHQSQHAHSHASSANHSLVPSSDFSHRLALIKGEIADTVKKAFDVANSHLGNALPEPARSRVRGYLRDLPRRWAAQAQPLPAYEASSAANDVNKGVNGSHYTNGKLNSHPDEMKGVNELNGGEGSNGLNGHGPLPPIKLENGAIINGHSRDQEAAGRMIIFARESLHTLTQVTDIVSDTINWADNWLATFSPHQRQEALRRYENEPSSSNVPL